MYPSPTDASYFKANLLTVEYSTDVSINTYSAKIIKVSKGGILICDIISSSIKWNVADVLFLTVPEGFMWPLDVHIFALVNWI